MFLLIKNSILNIQSSCLWNPKAQKNLHYLQKLTDIPKTDEIVPQDAIRKILSSWGVFGSISYSYDYKPFSSPSPNHKHILVFQKGLRNTDCDEAQLETYVKHVLKEMNSSLLFQCPNLSEFPECLKQYIGLLLSVKTVTTSFEFQSIFRKNHF